jgi:hypothetical protein
VSEQRTKDQQPVKIGASGKHFCCACAEFLVVARERVVDGRIVEVDYTCRGCDLKMTERNKVEAWCSASPWGLHEYGNEEQGEPRNECRHCHSPLPSATP